MLQLKANKKLKRFRSDSQGSIFKVLINFISICCCFILRCSLLYVDSMQLDNRKNVNWHKICKKFEDDVIN